ncbi:MAG: SoxXA-binding protein [Acidiferrobacterales bacterium]
MKKTVLLATLALATGGCATHVAPKGTSVADTIAAAHQAVAGANKEHVDLWVSTAKDVKMAEKLNSEGKSAKAGKLAQTALRQVDLAEQQAKTNADAMPYYRP